MKLILSRLIAILLLVIPGIGAAYGFLLMKDAFYSYFADMGVDDVSAQFHWVSFLIGFILFIVGVGFIGGWIFFRDRKHNYLSSRFRPKRPRPPRQSEPEGGSNRGSRD